MMVSGGSASSTAKGDPPDGPSPHSARFASTAPRYLFQCAYASPPGSGNPATQQTVSHIAGGGGGGNGVGGQVSLWREALLWRV